MLSGRITSARVVGTLFSIDPAMSVIIARADTAPDHYRGGRALASSSSPSRVPLLVWASGGVDANGKVGQ